MLQCRESKLELAEGAANFFDFLKNNQIKFNIATNSGPENIGFFFEHFNLSKWLGRENIFFNDGTLPGKPAPDLFIKAAAQLGLPLSDLIIFEDSEAGLKAAQEAGAGKVFIINPHNQPYPNWEFPQIKNFNELERTLWV